jgi:tetratricopeptide (TPR) repeat protein
VAGTLEWAQEYQAALEHYQKALAILEVDGTPEDRVAARLGLARGYERRNEAGKSLDQCQRAWELQVRLPRDSSQLLNIKACVARAHIRQGNLARAAAVGRELAQMAVAPTEETVAWRLDASTQAVSLCLAGGDHACARQMAQWQLELGRTQLPTDSAAYADLLNSAVEALTQMGDHQAALPYAVIAQDLNHRLRGDLDFRARLSFSNLGWIHVGLGRYLEAKGWFTRALDASRLTGRPYFIDVHNLGEAELMLGELDAAHDHFKSALETAAAVYGEQHPLLAWPLRGLARVALAQDHVDEAAELAARALALRRPLGNHPEVADALQTMGEVQLAQSNVTAARASFEECRAVRVRLFGERHAWVSDADFGMAEAVAANADFAAANRLHVKVLALRLQTLPVEHPKVMQSVEALGRMSLMTGDLAEASRRMATVWKLQRAALGPEHALVKAAAARAQDLCAEAGTPCVGDAALSRVAVEPKALLLP